MELTWCNENVAPRAKGIADTIMPDERAERAQSLASKLAHRDDWLAKALERLYAPPWQPVLRSLDGMLGERAQELVTALLRRNREDLCGRPLAAAVAAASAAGRRALPSTLLDGLCDKVIALYFDRMPWPPRGCTLALLEACGEHAVPQLVNRLSSSDRIARARAALALGHLRAQEAVPELVALLYDQDSLFRKQGAAALGTIGTVTAIEAALRQAERDQSIAQHLGQGMLRSSGPNDCAMHVVRCLEGKSSRMELLAARIRMRFCAGYSAPHLLDLLDAEDWDSKVIAAEILGYVEASDALPQLIERSMHDRALMRWGATLALGRIGAVEGMPHLRRLAKDEDYHVRTAANDALEWNSAGRKVPTVAGWLGYFGNPRLIQQIRSSDDAAEVAQQLGASCRAVRQAAREAIARSGSEAVVQWALSKLKDGNLSNRWHAVLALGDVGDEAVLPELLRLLEDQSNHIRSAVALAAERIGWRLRRPIPVSQAPPTIRLRAESLATSLDALASSAET